MNHPPADRPILACGLAGAHRFTPALRAAPRPAHAHVNTPKPGRRPV